MLAFSRTKHKAVITGCKALGVLCFVGLAGCAPMDRDHPPMSMTVDGVPMEVYWQEAVLNYEIPSVYDPETGIISQGPIPFPLVDGYVVTRRDGQENELEDEALATSAAKHFCAKQQKVPSRFVSFDELQKSDRRIWFFWGCRT